MLIYKNSDSTRIYPFLDPLLDTGKEENNRLLASCGYFEVSHDREIEKIKINMQLPGLHPTECEELIACIREAILLTQEKAT